MASAAECWVLDVGQGSSQIILLPDGGLIVIDCGPVGGARIPIQVLDRYKGPIEAFIVTHNDSDHDGGASKLFINFAPRIKKTFFVHDRPHEEILLWSIIKRERARDRYKGTEERLEWAPGKRPLYHSPEHKLSLRVLAPDFETASANVNNGNAMSGLLVLRCGERRVVFPGDATIEEWRSLRARLPKPLGCDVLITPHHGGALGDETWLYTEGVKPEYAIVSVGSVNQHHHPKAETIHSLLNAGAKVLCTQITRKCCDLLENLRPGMIPPTPPSRATSELDVNKRGGSRNVGCAGTVIVAISQEKVEIQRYDVHQRSIDLKVGSAGFHPLCRKPA